MLEFFVKEALVYTHYIISDCQTQTHRHVSTNMDTHTRAPTPTLGIFITKLDRKQGILSDTQTD